MDFRTDFDNMIRPLEEKAERLANFKVDLCLKIEQVHFELLKLKKGACLYITLLTTAQQYNDCGNLPGGRRFRYLLFANSGSLRAMQPT